MNIETVPQLQIWALIVVLGVLGSIAIASIRWGILRVIKALDAIQRDMHRMSMNMATHDQRIQSLHDADNLATTRMNDHSTRLRTAEQEIAILKSKNNI